MQEKLDWAFNLYDIDGNGFISREECLEIITAIHCMMGKLFMSFLISICKRTKYSDVIGFYRHPAPKQRNTSDVKSESPQSMTDKIFSQLDKNMDGRVSKEEFIEGSSANPSIISILSKTQDR